MGTQNNNKIMYSTCRGSVFRQMPGAKLGASSSSVETSELMLGTSAHPSDDLDMSGHPPHLDASARPNRSDNFRQQMETSLQRQPTASSLDTFNSDTAGVATIDITARFESKFAPSDMRQLALVAHNHMKPAMKDFILTFSEILKKFRITGTQTTMSMCKELWGDDDEDIEYGLTCTSGPLGGDAQIAALMCVGDLGGLIFFADPLSAHPHQADIDSLCRLSNVGNVIVCMNPSSAMSMMHILKLALRTGNSEMIPSFFQTLESPAVAEYKRKQELALNAVVAGRRHCMPPDGLSDSMVTGNLPQDVLQSLYIDNENCEDKDEDVNDKQSEAMDESSVGSKLKAELLEGQQESAVIQDAHPQSKLSKNESTTIMAKLYGIKKQPKKKRKTVEALKRSLTKRSLTKPGIKKTLTKAHQMPSQYYSSLSKQNK